MAVFGLKTFGMDFKSFQGTPTFLVTDKDGVETTFVGAQDLGEVKSWCLQHKQISIPVLEDATPGDQGKEHNTKSSDSAAAVFTEVHGTCSDESNKCVEKT